MLSDTRIFASFCKRSVYLENVEDYADSLQIFWVFTTLMMHGFPVSRGFSGTKNCVIQGLAVIECLILVPSIG
jgi:hypothetical protein